MKRIFILLLFSIFGCTFSQEINAKKLDQYFETLADHHKVMGSFAIAKDGEIIYRKAIGLADVLTGKKADENTVYRIGSISKTFTAVLVMKAVEENKLKLDQKLSDFYPQIKNANQITIRELLSHRSGIHNFTDDEQYWKYNTAPISETELVKIIVAGGSDFQPGEKFSYSNSNYSLLGFILEKIYKKSYAKLLQEKICQPLDLKLTKVGTKINPENNVANSYTYSEDKYHVSEETDLSVPLGAGNIVSTPSELIQFMNALVSNKLISVDSFEKMKNFKDHYGFGLSEVPFDGKRGFGHSGGIDNFQSVLYYFPDGKVTFAMITNQSNFDNNSISIAALSAAYGLEFQVPSFDVIAVDVADLKPLEGLYSAPKFPLKIKVFVEDGKLMAQATGQGAFPLEATSRSEFKFDPAGITLKFNQEKGEMFYTQMGQAVTFTKEK